MLCVYILFRDEYCMFENILGFQEFEGVRFETGVQVERTIARSK